MKPIITQHEVYQDFVIDQLQQHYAGGVLTLVHRDWPIIAKLWMTDLTSITVMLQDFYSARGPAPRDPSAMLRSYLLFLLTNPEIGLLLGWISCTVFPFMPSLAVLSLVIFLAWVHSMISLLDYGLRRIRI